ncbi:MAG TPA: hypothetical protein VNO55_05440 [Polyangia bacterium]|nr:hypothetical protein [Polyangia bacterium]
MACLLQHQRLELVTLHSPDIIPIASRRMSATRPAGERGSERRTARVVALLVGISIFVVVGLILMAGERDRASVGHIETSQRAAIFERAHTDMLATCQLPEVAREPLRQHCLSQAGFVLLFPECDADCARAARALLPHARR